MENPYIYTGILEISQHHQYLQLRKTNYAKHTTQRNGLIILAFMSTMTDKYHAQE